MELPSNKVLIIDDDYESMHDLMQHLVKELKWNVELTASVDVLIRLSEEHFDLLIVDLMIRPTSKDQNGNLTQNIQYRDVKWDRTGLEFLRRFRNGEYSKKESGTSSDVPVIVLSAVADTTANGEWGKILKHEIYVEKPFRLSDLVKQMQSLVRQ